MRGSVPRIPNTPSWSGTRLKKAQGQLYLYFTYNKENVIRVELSYKE